jgi:hypothetical protein
MSLLTEREWCTSYRHEDGDLIELFASSEEFVGKLRLGQFAK